MTDYSFDMFKKANVDPRADAVVYGVTSGLLPFSAASDFEEWEIENRGAAGSPEVLVADSRKEALAALRHAGYRDPGSGRDVLRYVALASLDSDGSELLSDIESVYADFGYPEDMDSLIYYMPAVDSNPSPEKLIGRFHAFLASEKRRLGL